MKKAIASLLCIVMAEAVKADDKTGIYLETNGLVVMEVENTASDLDQWSLMTDVPGYTGRGYLQFTGNTPISGPAQSPLEYKFKINKPGLYELNLFCAKERYLEREDVANDGYVRVDGDYGPGPKVGDDHGDDAPLSALKQDTKMYGGSDMKFDWAYGNRLDLGGRNNKRVAVYDFKAGEEYTLVISGRSQLFKIDRIVFRHIDTPLEHAHDLSLPESKRPGGETLRSAALWTPEAGIYGELKKWHRITVAFEGPESAEDASPNPFMDYRLNVTFTHPASGKTCTVPGYYAADGNAGETGAASGSIWRAHFSPDEVGAWTYAASFRAGDGIAVEASPDAGSAVSFDGASGTFQVVASDKTGIDLRGKGRLQYNGTRYLMFAETGEAFLKMGADAPENFLAYADFDNTYTHGEKNFIKSWKPHVRDWREGDPTWQVGKGKGLIGAINYLASEGQNAFSFLTYNAGGDSKDVWPYIAHTDPTRFDCSKLDQWEVVFSHADRMGMYLHFKTQETENDDSGPYALDGGELGPQRKLYYRELIARFGHHMALNWNLGEENTQTTEQHQAMAGYFHDTDPYHHLIVLHTYPKEQEKRYRPLLGEESELTGVSIQIDYDQVHQETLQWITESTEAGKPWVVANDEQGPANFANPPDTGYAGYDGTSEPAQRQMRSNVGWGNLMAGGAGVELYAGYKMPESDLTLQDFRSRDRMWDYNRHALEFFSQYLPFTEMAIADGLIGNPENDNSKYAFAKPGDVYAVYLADGGTTELDLTGVAGSFTVQWFNPRDGGPLQQGNVVSVNGGGVVSLGNPPADGSDDWTILVRCQHEINR